jgi:lipopolysaccharide transport system ATP-binding protein
MEDSAITFDMISKRYQLGSSQSSLREAAAQFMGRWLGRKGARAVPSFIWALKDVSFDLPRGEALGIIGRNGAGKTTMLKLLAGVTKPTQGHIQMRGRIGSLIELGAGFHPDLTGRENVFLNGQIMGMSRKTIASRYQEIVDFAELADFMDTPVKRYSSGMYARLGFAVAAHMDPDILLVDEVLSVGDASFQRKSSERMLTLVNSGKTVIFVSHNLLAVERMCSQVMWLDHGCVRMVAPARQVIKAYLDSEDERLLGGAVGPQHGRNLTIDSVTLLDGDGQPAQEFSSGQDIVVCIRYTTADALRNARFNLGVSSGRGLVFTANMLLDGTVVSQAAGTGKLTCTLRSVPLMPGVYHLYGEVWGTNGFDRIVPWSEWVRFRVYVDDRSGLRLIEDFSVTHVQADAPVIVQHEWRVE